MRFISRSIWWSSLALLYLQVLTNGHREPAEPKIVSDKYGQIAAPYPYDSSVDCPSKNMATMQRNGHFVREYGVEGQSIGMMSQQSRQRRFLSPSRDNEFVPGNEDMLQLDRKRKVSWSFISLFLAVIEALPTMLFYSLCFRSRLNCWFLAEWRIWNGKRSSSQWKTDAERTWETRSSTAESTEYLHFLMCSFWILI